MQCDRKSTKWQRTSWKIKWFFQRLFHKHEESVMETWARNELELIEKQPGGDADGLKMQKLITKDVMAIVKVFCGQGHSGFSASYALNLIKRLLGWKPITALTGADDEWAESYNSNGTATQQNKRGPGVFRENFDNSTAIYLDGKVFSDDGGHSWFSKYESRIPVTFPFYVPEKPIYVYLNKDGKEITREEAEKLFESEPKEETKE